MHYKRAETIGTAPHPRSLDPASVGQVLRGGPADAQDIEAFSQTISLQAAARTARYAEGAPAFSEEAAGAFHTIGLQQEKRPDDGDSLCALLPAHDTKGAASELRQGIPGDTAKD
jgi:hypothetical protein